MKEEQLDGMIRQSVLASNGHTSAAPSAAAEGDRVGWVAFSRGETPLDFGQRYFFANPATNECGIRWAHQTPPAATWCVKLSDLMATIPSTANTTPGDAREHSSPQQVDGDKSRDET